jgi:hypothetical protein
MPPAQEQCRPRNVRPPKSRPAACIEASTEGLPLKESPSANPPQQNGPQGLRRPRFSFFRFTCQTARNRDGSHSTGKPESRRSFMLPMRIGSLGHRISVRCFAGATSRRKRTARRIGLYSLAAGRLSTLKAATRSGFPLAAERRRIADRRIPGAYLSPRRRAANRRRKRAPGPGHAALRPHSSAVLGGSGGRCQFGGYLRQGCSIRDPSGVTRNRLKQLAQAVGK